MDGKHFHPNDRDWRRSCGLEKSQYGLLVRDVTSYGGFIKSETASGNFPNFDTKLINTQMEESERTVVLPAADKQESTPPNQKPLECINNKDVKHLM